MSGKEQKRPPREKVKDGEQKRPIREGGYNPPPDESEPPDKAPPWPKKEE